MTSIHLPSLEEIVETFELLDGWSDRYGYLIDLGRSLPDLSSEQRIEENVVAGCLSTVWLAAEPLHDERRTIVLAADSDAAIVKGLIAILLAMFSGKSAAEILALDPRVLFESLGLRQNLSVARSNGVNAMIQRIKEIARSEQQAAHAAATAS
ncbi:MAG: SufE family protein [Planctomycetia bacterium]|nr:SufE family protein [Planctomycetia bacterium]